MAQELINKIHAITTVVDKTSLNRTSDNFGHVSIDANVTIHWTPVASIFQSSVATRDNRHHMGPTAAATQIECGTLTSNAKQRDLHEAKQNSTSSEQYTHSHIHRHAIEAKVMRWTGRYVTKLIICSFGWMNWKTTVPNQLYLVSFPCFATNDVLFAIYFMVGRITWWRMKRPTYRTASSPASRAAVKTTALLPTINTNKYRGLILIQMYNSFSLIPHFSQLLNILCVSSLLLLIARLLYTRHFLLKTNISSWKKKKRIILF